MYAFHDWYFRSTMITPYAIQNEGKWNRVSNGKQWFVLR